MLSAKGFVLEGVLSAFLYQLGGMLELCFFSFLRWAWYFASPVTEALREFGICKVISVAITTFRLYTALFSNSVCVIWRGYTLALNA